MEGKMDHVQHLREALSSIDAQVSKLTAEVDKLKVVVENSTKDLREGSFKLATLTKHRISVDNMIAALTGTAPVRATAVAAAGAEGVGRHKGYINKALPLLYENQEAASGRIHQFLLADFPELKRPSVDAFLNAELKRQVPRITRVRPGVYAITEAGIKWVNDNPDGGAEAAPEGNSGDSEAIVEKAQTV